MVGSLKQAMPEISVHQADFRYQTIFADGAGSAVAEPFLRTVLRSYNRAMYYT